jgi:hypothetical protein
MFLLRALSEEMIFRGHSIRESSMKQSLVGCAWHGFDLFDFRLLHCAQWALATGRSLSHQTCTHASALKGLFHNTRLRTNGKSASK